jgi:hypothetical protein
MSDTTGGVERGRRRYARQHGDVRVRAFDASEVGASAVEKGAALWAARAGNRSAADAIAAARNDDDGGGAA